MRKFIAVLVVACLTVTMAGCSPEWQKKFIRKKKDVKKMPRIYQLKRYEKRPSIELYQKHYVYWESWQSELIEVLGNNPKKDARCAEEALGQMRDMQYILVPEMGDKLDRHIATLEEAQEMILRGDMTQPINRDNVRRRLEKVDRVVKHDFCPKKVRNYIKKSFDEDDSMAPGMAEEDKPMPVTKMSPADAMIAKEEAKKAATKEIEEEVRQGSYTTTEEAGVGESK